MDSPNDNAQKLKIKPVPRGTDVPFARGLGQMSIAVIKENKSKKVPLKKFSHSEHLHGEGWWQNHT